jgi:hypothetical protein
MTDHTAEHTFPTGDNECLICHVAKKDAQSQPCLDPNPPMKVEGEKGRLRLDRRPRKPG